MKIIRNLADTSEIYQVLKYLHNYIQTRDKQCPKSPYLKDHPIFINLHQKLRPQLEKAFGVDLVGTYTYARIYPHGEILEKHTDRPACEYSCTMTIGYEGELVWPIFITDTDDTTHKAILEPGDALLYEGCDCEHWRKQFEGTYQIQLFLHYVDKNGKYKDQAHDNQKELNARNESSRGSREGRIIKTTIL